MAIVVDSGAVYGLYDRRDVHHQALRRVVESTRERLVLPVPMLGEIDYLLRARLGSAALLAFLADLQTGAFALESVTLNDLRRCEALIAQYENLDLGVSDACVVAVAERLGTDQILTVDQRDFRTMRSIHGKAFRLLPADSLQ